MHMLNTIYFSTFMFTERGEDVLSKMGVRMESEGGWGEEEGGGGKAGGSKRKPPLPQSRNA